MPQQPEWDDVQMLWLRQLAMPRYPAVIRDALAGLAAGGEQRARTMCVGIHPWLLGQPHRIRYLDQALKALATSRDAARQFDVWLRRAESAASSAEVQWRGAVSANKRTTGTYGSLDLQVSARENLQAIRSALTSNPAAEVRER